MPRRRLHTLATVAGALLAMILSPSPGHAQDVSGTVRDSVTGTPVRGAVVTVLAPNREILARGLTSSSGSFRLPIRAGTTLRVIRIGYLPTEMPLNSAITRVNIALLPAGRAIAAVSVRANPVCPRRADQDEALALWSAATDALLAVVVASEDSAHTGLMTQLMYDRLMNGTQVVRQSSRRAVTGNVSPIRSDREPESFVEDGYVIKRGDGYTYYAPDPETLLDSSFAATHCLSMRTDQRGHPGLTGVAFEPTSNRESTPDIQGVLWMSRNPLALHSLEFEYRGVEAGILNARAGGRIDFTTPGDDVPINSRWQVRSPRQRYREMRYGGRLITWEVHETGGLIADGTLTDGTSWSTPLARLRGNVRNAVGADPARYARVTFDSTDQVAITDSVGNFFFEHLLPGPHVLRVRDSIPIRAVRVNEQGELVPDTVVMQQVTRDASLALDVRLDSMPNIQVTMPWRAPVEGCGRPNTQLPERRFVVLGEVVNSERVHVPNVPIQLSWTQTIRGTTFETIVDARADASGGFIMCGIPGDLPLGTRVVTPSGTVSTGTTRLSSADRGALGGVPLPANMRAVTIRIP